MALEPTERRATDRRPRPGRRARTSLIPVGVLQGPFEFTTAVLSVILGAGVLVSSLFGHVGWTAIQTALLPLPIVIMWGIFTAVGGLGVLVSMFLRERGECHSFVVETTSLVLLATGWAVYSIVPLFGVGSTVTVFIGACVILACALRVRAILVAAQVTKETIALRDEMR